MLRLSCDVGALPADGVALDALARLQLAARRAGLELELCNASRELCCLITFTGLEEVLCVEAGRKAFKAGRIARKLYATASSPLSGLIE